MHTIKTICLKDEVTELYHRPYDTELAETLKAIWDNKDFLTPEDLTNLGFFAKKSYLDEYKLTEK
jgi:hypothetical protein